MNRKEVKPTPSDDQKGVGKALHGEPTEVSWDGGAGRQPYTNQGTEEQRAPADAEYAEGDRGKRSGNNLEQLAEVKRKP